MNGPIHIALCFDDNFWAPAYAVMRSTCLSTTLRQQLVFHLLHMPLGDRHRADLEKIADEFGASLVFYPLAELPQFDEMAGRLPQHSRWPKIVYARLLLPQLLPETVERVIYLDSDMLVRAPIEDLFSADIGEKPLAAVRDAQSPFIPLRRDMREKRHLFDGAEPYFNSGLLLMVPAKWRALDIGAWIEKTAETADLGELYFDQDLLNLMFRGHWHELPWRWNVIDAQWAHEALNPAILHYTQAQKPWHLLAGVFHNVAYARWYRHVMTNELFYRFAAHRRQRWWKRLLRLEY